MGQKIEETIISLCDLIQTKAKGLNVADFNTSEELKALAEVVSATSVLISSHSQVVLLSKLTESHIQKKPWN